MSASDFVPSATGAARGQIPNISIGSARYAPFSWRHRAALQEGPLGNEQPTSRELIERALA
jgi:hypothetical protein